MAGREGVRRFEPEAELPFEDAIARQLRRLDPSLSANTIKDLIAGRDREEVLTGMHRTQQTRPDNVLSFFKAFLRKQPPRDVVKPLEIGAPLPVSVPDDPYA